VSLHAAILPGRTAVITGGASGIGLATARRLSAAGMQVCLADSDEHALRAVRPTFGDNVRTRVTDVSNADDVNALADWAFAECGDVAVLMNNAGTGGGGGAFARLAGWQRVLGVNLWGVVHGLQAFTQRMIDQNAPAAIINTGSKQGITNPPGDAAYNVSKAGVRSVTESLAHELRSIDGCAVTAHLLVPGFTYTGLIRKHIPRQPPAAWSPGQVADELLRRLGTGDFYILCPDNDVTVAMDVARLQWNTDDISNNRPALSRWHPDYEEEFARFMVERA